MKNSIFYLIWFLNLFCGMTGLASERNFEIKVGQEAIKVSSPPQFFEKFSVVIDNELFAPIIGTLYSEDERPLWHFRIDSQHSKFFKMELKKAEKMHLIILSPPRTEVELAFGNRDYQIF